MDEIEKYVEHLKSGGVLVYPTETIWGLGADFEDQKANEKIYQLKGRHFTKPLLLLIPHVYWVFRLTTLPETFKDFLTTLWPSSLTLVLPASSLIPHWIHQGTHFIGLRQSPHPFVKSLLNIYNRPISSTSVNQSGKAPATDFLSAFQFSKDRDVKTASWNEERPSSPVSSTVVKLSEDFQRFSLLREGTFSKEDVERLFKDFF
ncbi:MAG: Sua5/YciO/YrdC/YwlC family protein [Bdellovibrio sp.]|nr:MAG: Sua5/YciO/YrdC/YwlC family protein [Bdellovibrio sp.]